MTKSVQALMKGHVYSIKIIRTDAVVRANFGTRILTLTPEPVVGVHAPQNTDRTKSGLKSADD